MTYRPLIFANLLLSLIVLLFVVHYDIPQKVVARFRSKKVQSVIDNKPSPCLYEFSAFDFHYQKQPDSVRVVLFGNSIVRYGDWPALLGRPDVINRGIDGEITRCMCDRLQYLRGLKAKAWVIEGGINDLTTLPPVDVFNNYKTIIQFVKSEGAVPVVNLVFYLSAKAGIAYPARTDYQLINRRIDTLNTWLIDYAHKNDLPCIDLNKTVSKGGVMLDDYTSDGVHLNEKGYQEWAKLIRQALKQIE